MGKGPKHNNAKPRSNGIFKVAGTNFKDKAGKGKPKEVSSNLKLISLKNKSKVAELDKTLMELQKASALAGKSLGGEDAKGREVKGEVKKVVMVEEEEMEDLADSMKSKA